MLELDPRGVDAEPLGEPPLEADRHVAQPDRPVTLVEEGLGDDADGIREIDEPGVLRGPPGGGLGELEDDRDRPQRLREAARAGRLLADAAEPRRDRLVAETGRLAADPELDDDEVGAVEGGIPIRRRDEPAAPAAPVEHPPGEVADDPEALGFDVEQGELVDREARLAGGEAVDELGRVGAATADDGDLHAHPRPSAVIAYIYSSKQSRPFDDCARVDRRDIIEAREVTMRVALTFDAEHPDREHRIGVHDGMLAVLAGRDVHATFFLQGRWVEANPEAARRVAEDGHLVGNHSFYHARLPLLSDEGLVTDVCDAERAIRDIVGVDPRPWFRCPFLAGEDDPRVVGALTGLGYRIVPVDIVLDDWESERTGDEHRRRRGRRGRPAGRRGSGRGDRPPPHLAAPGARRAARHDRRDARSRGHLHRCRRAAAVALDRERMSGRS